MVSMLAMKPRSIKVPGFLAKTPGFLGLDFVVSGAGDFIGLIFALLDAPPEEVVADDFVSEAIAEVPSRVASSTINWALVTEPKARCKYV